MPLSSHHESRKVKKYSFYRSCLAKICYKLNNVVTACPVSSSLSIRGINLLENTFDTTVWCYLSGQLRILKNEQERMIKINKVYECLYIFRYVLMVNFYKEYKTIINPVKKYNPK